MTRIGFIGVLDIYGFDQFEFMVLNSYRLMMQMRIFKIINTHLFEVEQNSHAEDDFDGIYITFSDFCARHLSKILREMSVINLLLTIIVTWSCESVIFCILAFGSILLKILEPSYGNHFCILVDKGRGEIA